MAIPTTYTWAAANTTYTCLAQTASSGVSLIFNGSGADKTSTTLLNSPRMTLTGSGFERTVSIASTGVVSGVTFRITGRGIRGNTITENVTGPSSNTVYSTNYFYEVTSVVPNGTLSTSTSVGIGTTGQSQWYIPDYQLTPVNLGLGVTVVSGTINWTVRQTTYNVQTAEPPSAAIIDNSDTNLVAQTVSRQGNYVLPFGGTRCVINSSTDGALVYNIYQAGIV